MSLRWKLSLLGERVWKASASLQHGREGYMEILRKGNGRILDVLHQVDRSAFQGKILAEVGGGLHGVLPFLEGARSRTNFDPLSLEGTREGVNHVRARGEEIPLPESSVDVVFCSNCLNHVDDAERVLEEILRVLVPGGFLFLDVHIQPRSMNHTYAYTPAQLANLVSDRFELCHFGMSSTFRVYGQGPWSDFPIWYCLAMREVM